MFIQIKRMNDWCSAVRRASFSTSSQSSSLSTAGTSGSNIALRIGLGLACIVLLAGGIVGGCGILPAIGLITFVLAIPLVGMTLVGVTTSTTQKPRLFTPEQKNKGQCCLTAFRFGWLY